MSSGLLSIDMDVDTPADFGMDAAMDFDMGGDFLLGHGLIRAASESSLEADSTRKIGKRNKQVRHIARPDFLF
jgi:hypothetical protein